MLNSTSPDQKQYNLYAKHLAHCETSIIYSPIKVIAEKKDLLLSQSIYYKHKPIYSGLINLLILYKAFHVETNL